MSRLLAGLFGLSLAVLFVGCAPSDPEIAKHEPLVKELVQLTTTLADTLEQMQKETRVNPLNAPKYAEQVHALSVQLETKSAEFAKLPKNVQSSFDAKYKVQLQDAGRRLKAAMDRHEETSRQLGEDLSKRK